jgi:outer membrane protein OmpA-like peptidoglycan-associated protein
MWWRPLSSPRLKRPGARGDAHAVRGDLRRRVSAARADLIAAAAIALAPHVVLAADSPIGTTRHSASPEGAIATESSQVLPKWTPAASVALSHEAGLHLSRGADLQSRTSANLAIAFGLFDWVELSGELPLVVAQRVANDGSSGVARGLGDVRAGLKGTLLRLPRRGIGLGLMFDVTAPTGSGARHLGIGGLAYAPQVLFELRGARAIRGAFALGYLARPEVARDRRIAGDEITTRAATRIPLVPSQAVALVAEIDGRIAMTRGADHRLAGRTGLRGQTRAGLVLGFYATAAAPIGFADGEVGGIFTVGWAPPIRSGTARAFDGSPRPTATALALRDDAPGGDDEPAPRERAADDLDGDGVRAAADRCPSVAEDRDAFEDSDGCPDRDDDGDGLADAYDLCPRAPEIVNGGLDHDGCPDRADATGRFATLSTIDPSSLAPSLDFDGGTATLTAASVASLDAWIELARLNPWMTRLDVSVYVHASDDPDRDHALASARAQAIVRRVRDAGIEPWRVDVRELGALDPAARERTRVAVIGAGAPGTVGPDPAALRRWFAREQIDAARPAPAVDLAAQGP